MTNSSSVLKNIKFYCYYSLREIIKSEYVYGEFPKDFYYDNVTWKWSEYV